MSAAVDTRPGMGAVPRTHNNPPGPVPLIETTGLADQLRLDWRHLYERRDQMVEMVNGWLTDHPNGIETADDAALANDVLGQVLREVDVVDKSSSVGIRAEIKRPIIEAGRIVDGVFGSELAENLRCVAAKMNAVLLTYAKRKREEERVEQLRQQQEQERAQQQASALAKQAADAAAAKALASLSVDDIDAAVAAEQAELDAQEAAARPARPPTPVSTRVHGDSGTISYMNGRWFAVIREPHNVPRELCSPDQRLINVAMHSSIPKAKGGRPTIVIPGVEFVFEDKLRTRR